MDPKTFFHNKSMCPLPWTGFIVNQNGDVKNCVLSKEKLGNLNEDNIVNILNGPKARTIKEEMIKDLKPKNCAGCYQLEENKKSVDIISQRLYYIKELRKVEPSIYDDPEKFSLHTVDMRWTNQCNQACVYCGPHNSTMWEKELGASNKIDPIEKQNIKKFIFENIDNLQNVYLAGGEPTLMNENMELLEMLHKRNKDVTLRINTNLSNTNTKVCKLIKQFKNVHWIVSVEASESRYEYIRYGGSWKTFLTNLEEISKIKNHKISFNMLYFVLNYKNMFDCIDQLLQMRFHPNAFVLGPLYTPTYLSVLNLPNHKKELVKNILQDKIKNCESFLLKDGYINLLKHMGTQFAGDIEETFEQLNLMDGRRCLSSREIFPEVYGD